MAPDVQTSQAPKTLPIRWRAWAEAALAWVMVGTLVMRFYFEADPQVLRTYWVVVALGVIDLVTTGGLLRAMMALAAGREKNGVHSAILTSAWGVTKLVSVGLLTMTIWRLRAGSALPLILGLATLIAVPIIGGLRWYWLGQAELTNSTI